MGKAGAYYNEIEPFAAGWLRELIRRGLIAPGEVDERDIRDVHPSDLRGFTQCHFFAGVGGWSYALRLAGWADKTAVWTGSCPCQPFSAAGKGEGFADERHLWPAFFHLISECRPPVIFGEQVASKDGLAWLDLVSADLEGAGYAFGAADLCAGGVGAPHIRQRLYWVGHAEGNEQRWLWEPQPERRGAIAARGPGATCGLADCDSPGQQPDHRPVQPAQRDDAWRRGTVGGLGNASDLRRSRRRLRDSRATDGNGREATEREPHRNSAAASSASRWVGDSHPARLEEREGQRSNDGAQLATAERTGDAPSLLVDDGERPGPTNGFWRDADWLFCRDGWWRPVESGTFALGNGLPARVGRLRGYGNAIVPQTAQVFIEAFLEALEEI